MGKATTEADYNAAREQLNTCRLETCRNGRGGEANPPCKTCIRAFRTKKEYERARPR